MAGSFYSFLALALFLAQPIWAQVAMPTMDRLTRDPDPESTEFKRTPVDQASIRDAVGRINNGGCARGITPKEH